MRTTLFAALATGLLCTLLVPAAAAQLLDVEVDGPNPGPWNEPCFSADVTVLNGNVFHQGTCAGKGLLYPTVLGAPLDCVVWINNSVLGIPVLYFFCVGI